MFKAQRGKVIYSNSNSEANWEIGTQTSGLEICGTTTTCSKILHTLLYNRGQGKRSPKSSRYSLDPLTKHHI